MIEQLKRLSLHRRVSLAIAVACGALCMALLLFALR
jgi:hypothetical protein